ncbi:MAG: DUF4369 domain-containing protein [Bacteroidaceae bacterium]|nr:DUF4369 domain-containing protein [Bacteroidaceae bacterium]MBQ9498535.1 DUF4369 domain-containing protein [Bacteroidaceae bacterium]
MRFIFQCLLFTLLLTSCSGNKQQMCRLSGELTGITDDTLLLWGTDRLYQRIDTIPVKGGKFDVRIPLDTLVEAILYTPDGEQHPLFLERGTRVTLRGSLPDSLYASGSYNDSIYALLDTIRSVIPNDTLLPRQLALQYLRRHPGDPSAVFVVRHFFAEEDPAPVREHVREALSLLNPFMRDYPLIAQLDDQYSRNDEVSLQHSLPTFSIPDKDGVIINRFRYGGRPILLHFWATWSPESREQSRALRPLYESEKKQYRKETDRLAILGISLDSDRSQWLDAVAADSLEWDQACNFRAWDLDLLRRLNITTLPCNILVNDRGSIRGINLTTEQIEEELKAIRKEKEEQEKAQKERERERRARR